MNLYERLREACSERDTTLTRALTEIGRASGNTGSWKAGKSPSIDIIMDLAEHLHMSLDELVYGKTAAAKRQSVLTEEEKEWLDILSRIPEGRRDMCRDFLKTHMVEPEKYTGKKSG